MSARALWFLVVLAGLIQDPQPLPTELANIQFNSGQDVVPYFEGWIRNPNGTFDLVFGYFNRNWKEELAIPTGPENRVEPSGPDAGQPTYFLPRRQRWIFRIRVPADFGKKEVTWTITANGRAEKAYGNLLPAQEINERVVMNNGTLDPGNDDPNEPPSIAITPIRTAKVGTQVTLTASVADDGLPKPRPIQTPHPATPGFGAQTDRPDSGVQRGLTVRWLQYGGPAGVTLGRTDAIPLTNGQAVTTALFTMPGTYHLRATASDGALSTTADMIVTVEAPN